MSQTPPQQPQQPGTQVSVEDVFPIYRKRVSDLQDETLILRAKVDVLEKQLAAAQAENASLKKTAVVPADPGKRPDRLRAPPAQQRPDRDDADLDQQNYLERRHERFLLGDAFPGEAAARDGVR
jgi:hypothetical protein